MLLNQSSVISSITASTASTSERRQVDSLKSYLFYFLLDYIFLLLSFLQVNPLRVCVCALVEQLLLLSRALSDTNGNCSSYSVFRNDSCLT